MQALKFTAGIIGFLAIYSFAGWVGGVTAPVLGPLFLAALIGACVWGLVKLSKAGR